MTSQPDKAAKEKPLRLCPAFSEARFEREIAIAIALQWGLALGVGVAIFFSSITASLSPLAQYAPFIVLGTLWMLMTIANTKAWRILHTVSAMIEHNPVGAEAQLAQAMRVPLLSRPVRLLMYHRLALLRFRQNAFAETAGICRAVLNTRLPRPAHTVRPHLLLMYVDASLQTGDLHGAHWGLTELRSGSLGFVEQMQCLTLQTRYELAAGYHGLALSNLPYKIQLAEMMPASQCGMLHVLFANAADHMRQPAVAKWLRQRADLLISESDVRILEQTIRNWGPPQTVPFQNF